MNFVFVNLKGYDGRCKLPLGLAYIVSAINNEENNIKVFDFNCKHNLSHLVEYLFRNKVDVCGVSLYGNVLNDALPIFYAIKRISPLTKVVVGGPFATVKARDILEQFNEIDIVIKGEGEGPFKELAKSNLNNIEHIHNIVFRHNGIVYETEYVEYPSEPLLPARSYFPTPAEYSIIEGKDTITSCIITARGCVNECSFCGICVDSNRKYKRLNYSLLCEDISILYNKYNVRHIECFDADFLLSPVNVNLICDIFSQYQDLTFTCTGCVKSILKNKDLLPKLRSSGCVRIEIGVESGSNEQLNRYKKHFSSIECFEAISYVQQSRIPIGLDIIPFDPKCNLNDIKETLIMLGKLGFDSCEYEDAYFITLTLYPKTSYHSDLLAEGKIYDILSEIYWDFDDSQMGEYYRYIYYYEKQLLPKIKLIRSKVYRIIHNCTISEKQHLLYVLSRLQKITYKYFMDILNCILSNDVPMRIVDKYISEITRCERVSTLVR